MGQQPYCTPRRANGKLRICLDPKDLNKAIIHENHKAPTLEEIAHVLMGATKFSKVNGNKAFCQHAPNGGSITPDNIQYPSRKVQILTCSLWTENVPRYLPNEDG